MRIVNLAEDTMGVPECTPEHGMSFYIETESHCLLFDTGASELTWKNAEHLGVDLKKVDTVIISHGHYDHAGGVQSFVDINPDAKIYIQASAAGEFFRKREGNGGYKYIGIDPGIPTLPQVTLLDGDCTIDEELSLFTGVKGKRMKPDTAKILKERKNGRYVADAFRHEQYLVISEGDQKVLLSGCAHNGLLNILDHFQSLYGCMPDSVISGLHLSKKHDFTEEEAEEIRALAKELDAISTVIYTGHCTGIPAYKILKEELGSQIQYVHCGQLVPIDTDEDFLADTRPVPEPSMPVKPRSTFRKGSRAYMKAHRVFAWGTVICFIMTMATGYMKK